MLFENLQNELRKVNLHLLPFKGLVKRRKRRQFIIRRKF